jgi:hypothetical protein
MIAKNRRAQVLARSRWAAPFALVLCALIFGASAPAASANHFYDSALVSWSPHGNAPKHGSTTFSAMQLQDGTRARFVAGNQRTKWRFVTSAGKVELVSRNAFFSSARKKPARFLLNGITWAWRMSHDKRYRFAQVVTGSYQNP